MATVSTALLDSLKAQLQALIDGTSPEITSAELSSLLAERTRLAKYIELHQGYRDANYASYKAGTGSVGNVDTEDANLKIAREDNRLNEIEITKEKNRIAGVLIPIKQAQVDTEQNRVIELLEIQAQTDPAAQAQLLALQKSKSFMSTKNIIVWGVVIVVVIIVAIWAFKKFRKK